MFLVDERFKLPVPAQLRSPGMDFFHVVESTMDLPVWIARVLQAPAKDSHPRYRKFLVDDVGSALRILRMHQWSERVLYALLPGYLTGLDGLSFQRCGKVWKCHEPDGVGHCWRIEVNGEMLLISGCGTSLGEEVGPEVVWSDTWSPHSR